MNELKVYHCNEWHNEYTEFYLKSEADKVIADKDAEIAQLQAMLEERNKQVGKLNEERRWRKFPDEMPQKYDDGDDFLIAVEHESTTCPKGYYVTIAELVDGSWSDDEGRDIDEYIEYDLENSIFRSQAPQGTKKGFYRNKVTHWMPLPKSPEEVK